MDHRRSLHPERGWLAALGCMASVLIAGCDDGATLTLPPDPAGGPRETPTSPDAVWPDAASPEGGVLSPGGVSPPGGDGNDADTSGDTDGRGAAPLPSDSAGPSAAPPPEGTAPDDPDDPAAADPTGAGSDDPDEPSPDEPPDDSPPDDPAPGDPAPGDPNEPDNPDPIPPNPSEPEPVDEEPSPPREDSSVPVEPSSDPSSSDPSSSDEPPGNEAPSHHPPGSDSPGGLPSFHISVIGSSTASGFGASSGALAWASLLEASLRARATTPLTLSNLAAGGYTAFDLAPGSGMVGSIDDAIGERPDLILVALAGSNDLNGTLTTEVFISQLVNLRDTAKAAGIPTFFMGTLPKNFSDESSRLLVDFDRAMASELGACWIPGANEPYAPCYIHVFELLSNASLGLATELDSGDGQHPNDAGHALLFEAARAIVQPYVCSQTSCR